MAKLPALETEIPEPAPELPHAWITAYRWAGDKRVDIHSHECDRSTWYAARWAVPRGAALQNLSAFRPVGEIVAQREPPPRVEGIAAELLCGDCPQHAVCHGAPLPANCRTCRHVVADAGWFCGLYGDELDAAQQRAGCDAWEVVACS